MRFACAVVVAGCGSAAPPPPVARAAPTAPAAPARPCPANVVAATDELDHCIAGDFAGAGWIVVSHHPPPVLGAPHDGSIAFVDASGRRVASLDLEVVFSAKPVYVADLDGDGNDEVIFSQSAWMMAGLHTRSGTVLRVFGVRGDVVKDLATVDLVQELEAEYRCAGTATFEPDPAGGKRLVVQTALEGTLPDGEACRPGRHAYRIAHDELVEQP